MDPDATINHDEPTPVYLQLAGILRARIERGDWAPNRQILSEAQLVQAYGLARETARKAVRLLIDEGALFTVPGRGTFVSPQGTSRPGQGEES